MLAYLPYNLQGERLTEAGNNKPHGTGIGKWSPANHDERDGEADGHVSVEKVRLRMSV